MKYHNKKTRVSKIVVKGDPDYHIEAQLNQDQTGWYVKEFYTRGIDVELLHEMVNLLITRIKDIERNEDT